MVAMMTNCEGLSAKLQEILESDDANSLLEWLYSYHRIQPTNVEMMSSLANECVEFGASKCLFDLVEGLRYVKPTFDAEKLPRSGVTALAYVAHSCPDDSHVINLMLTQCGATCLANVSCTIGVVHGLPIHFLLINLSLLEHLYQWYRGMSLVKLVILLCLEETKPILDSLRVLVKYTDSINDIAWTILKNGGLRQFAALLLIAWEEVITPFDTGLTIHQYITNEVHSITKGNFSIEEQGSWHRPTKIDPITEGNLSIEEQEYIYILKDAWTLLAIFERAGDDLTSYCSSRDTTQKSAAVDVVHDIFALLFKNGVNANMCDVNLYDCLKVEILPNDSLRSLFSLYTIDNFTPKAALATGFTNNLCTRPYKHTFMPIPKLACLEASTIACPPRKTTQSLPHTGVSSLPRQLGYFAMKFIKRFRYL